jgi:hypothetical protein
MVVAASVGCGAETGDSGGFAESGRGGTAGATSSNAGTAGTLAVGGSASGGAAASGGASSGGTTAIPVAGTGSGGTETGEVCATETASASLEPVYLAFAFDVSGSMGEGDYPWHDPKLKWEPVVAATRAVLEDPASAGLQASMTVFPIDADEDERCDPESYSEPDVAMSALPSTRFGAALDAIREEDWRGGTPTLAVVEGVLSYVEEHSAEHPGRYALVLVTDGHPQGCDDADEEIDALIELVSSVKDTIPTFVLGIKNPPLTDEDGEMAPDTVSDLMGVAEAGGTENAYFIDTGEPTRTSADFQAAIERIRGVAISCTLPLPEPPGDRVFEKDKIIVSYASEATTTELGYDPDCTTENGWHYDDLDAPTAVVLCERACAAIQSDANASLSVAFTCEAVIDVPR